MRIKEWFKSNKLTSEVKEVTPLSCPANQPNTECGLVEQLREKQKELKEFDSMYSFTLNECKNKIKFTALNPQLHLMLKYEPFIRYMQYDRYRSDSVDSYYFNTLMDEMIRDPMSEEIINMCIDFFVQYKQMVRDIKDAPQKKENLRKEIATLKQQLGIE